MPAPPAARILIVDDEPALTKSLCDTLGAEGYETVGCHSGAAALEALRATQFDLLLTDLLMPGMDGIELLQAAQKSDSNLVSILMTGAGSIASAVKAMQAGALDYITKPLELSVILAVLSRALNMRPDDPRQHDRRPRRAEDALRLQRGARVPEQGLQRSGRGGHRGLRPAGRVPAAHPVTRAARLLIGVVDLAAAAPARAQPADDELAPTRFDPAVCEQKKQDAKARQEAPARPGAAALAPPVTWSDFDLEGTLIDPEPTVRALMTPTMTRNRALTDSAREEIARPRASSATTSSGSARARRPPGRAPWCTWRRSRSCGGSTSA